ncbi:hypothetical protein MRX96_022672 [Rhipicephalus microplus]
MRRLSRLLKDDSQRASTPEIVLWTTATSLTLVGNSSKSSPNLSEAILNSSSSLSRRLSLSKLHVSGRLLFLWKTNFSRVSRSSANTEASESRRPVASHCHVAQHQRRRFDSLEDRPRYVLESTVLEQELNLVAVRPFR